MKVKVDGKRNISRRKLGKDGEMLERECYCIRAALPFDFLKPFAFQMIIVMMRFKQIHPSIRACQIRA